MIAAVDTNILVRAFKDLEPLHSTVVYAFTTKGQICHDHGRVIKGEYERNVGTTQGFRKWYQRLQQRQAIYYSPCKLPAKHRKKLAGLGCREHSDHVFLGGAFESDKVLVSEDSDVGKGPNGSISPHCDALKYLTEKVGLKVYDASEFCDIYLTV